MRNYNLIRISRRALLKKAGAAISVTPLAGLIGCGGGSGSSSGDDSAGGGGTGGTGGTGGNSTQWLGGGTSQMSADFPPTTDPLDLNLGNVICTLGGTNSYVIGPCFFDIDDFRQNISEGQSGVPMTLVLKLVDADCDPVVGALIEVWWCDRNGLYSGDDSESAGTVSRFDTEFCTGNDANALAAKWFRGTQQTDSVGNVYFLGCFPGWYPSRTTHIHFRVVVDNVQRLVSQFCFDDETCDDIYQDHSDYTGVARDTNNTGDFVFGADWQDYTMLVERQWDGSMLAYKAIQIV